MHLGDRPAQWAFRPLARIHSQRGVSPLLNGQLLGAELLRLSELLGALQIQLEVYPRRRRRSEGLGRCVHASRALAGRGASGDERASSSATLWMALLLFAVASVLLVRGWVDRTLGGSLLVAAV